METLEILEYIQLLGSTTMIWTLLQVWSSLEPIPVSLKAPKILSLLRFIISTPGKQTEGLQPSEALGKEHAGVFCRKAQRKKRC